LFRTGQALLFLGEFFELPHGELAAPTNDINTTVALALLTSVAYFYAGVFQLIVPVCKLNYTSITNIIEQRTDQLFHDWDIHGNGLVYKEDFIHYCKQNGSIVRSMEKFKADIHL
jgi:hypothetical protein